MDSQKHDETPLAIAWLPYSRERPSILAEDIKRMVLHCNTDTVAGKRDKTVLRLGFASSLRRSDIVNIDVEDIARTDEYLAVLVRKGKTDQQRKGRKIGISYGKHQETCPVTAVFEWLLASGISAGPLFQGLTKFDRPRLTRLSSQVVGLIVKDYCVRVGKKVPNFGAHSLRSGFATSAAIAGAQERKIQDQTGHFGKEMLRRYIREAQVFRDHAFKTLDL